MLRVVVWWWWLEESAPVVWRGEEDENEDEDENVCMDCMVVYVPNLLFVCVLTESKVRLGVASPRARKQKHPSNRHKMHPITAAAVCWFFRVALDLINDLQREWLLPLL